MSEKNNEQEQPTPIDPLTIGELIGLPEAAKLAGLSHIQMRKIAKNGRLKAKKVGRDWVTTAAAVELYKESRHRGQRTDLIKPS
jgi:hypothetical protein